MRIPMGHRKRRICGSKLAAGAALSLLTTSCATLSDSPSLRQRLDESSGATVTTLEQPVAFSRDRPMLAANARDYMYLGPVEINRGGELSYALWVAYCSTIDRIDGQRFTAPVTAWLLADDEPIELAQPERRVNRADWLYDTPVAGGDTVMYALTRAQMQLITQSQDVRIVINEAAGATAEFEPWRDGLSALPTFARYLDRPEISAVARAND